MVRRVSRFAISAVLGICVSAQSSFAAVISAEQALLSETPSAKERLLSIAQRDEAVRTLENLGVDQKVAVQRIAALSDSEAESIVSRIDSMPMGGATAEETFGIGALVMIVLLFITDLLGLTKFFSFTQR